MAEISIESLPTPQLLTIYSNMADQLVGEHDEMQRLAKIDVFVLVRAELLRRAIPREKYRADADLTGKQDHPSTRIELVGWLNSLAQKVGILSATKPGFYFCTPKTFGRSRSQAIAATAK